MSPGVTLPLTLTGLPDASDEPYFGAPAAVGNTPPGPPYGPPLTLSCAWNIANYPSPGSAQGPGPVTPASLCSAQVAPPGFATVGGGGPLAGTALTGFGETTINLTGVSQPEADAVWTALKWKMQEMAQTDTDGDGIPDSPYGPVYPATPTYPVIGYFDNCPTAPNANQKDSGGINTTNPDGIGDACQCGDVTNDGIVNVSDKTILGRSLALLSPYFSVGAMPGFNKCNVNTPVNGSCDTGDKTVIGRTLANLPPGILQNCHAATVFP